MILLYGGNVNFNWLNNLYSNYFNIPSIRVESMNNIIFYGKIYEYLNSIGALFRGTEV